MTGVLLSTACVAYFYALNTAIFSSARFSPIFRLLLSVYDAKSAWLILAVCLVAAAWHGAAPIRRLLDYIARYPAALAAIAVIFFSLGARLVYHGYALSMDEYAAVFQSKIFAMGNLAAHMPPRLIDWLIVPGFNGTFLVGSPRTGLAIEAYWPGFALLLAPFQALGIPWLCNALLAGVALHLIFGITEQITGDRRSAGFAVLVAVASGAFVANAISLYPMQAHLTANLLFARLLLKPTKYRALAAGIVGSVALVLHNPFPHILFAAPWLAAMVRGRDQRRYLPPLILGYLPLSILIGFGWLALRHQIGAGVPRGAFDAGTLAAIFRIPNAAILSMRIAALAKMWVWASPCLLIFAVIGRIRYAGNRHVRLLAQSAVLTFIGYLFVNFDQGHGWGYRYFHSAWGAIPILAGCAMAGRVESADRFVSFAGATAILSLLVIVPCQLSQIDEFIGRHLAQLPPPRRPGNNVYFINPRGGFYIADMIQSDPGLRSPDLLLVSYGREPVRALVDRNWPNAVRIGGGPWGEQWYLGPIDLRAGGGGAGGRHFAFPPEPIRSR